MIAKPAKPIDCIRKFIEDNYKGGVVKVSDVSKEYGFSEGQIIKALSVLEKLGEVRIEKRYSCPEFHYMRAGDLPFCTECDDEYPVELINVYFYFKPLTKVH
jgi:hypothetical protein